MAGGMRDEGDDSVAAGSQAAPFRTIEHALATLARGQDNGESVGTELMARAWFDQADSCCRAVLSQPAASAGRAAPRDTPSGEGGRC